MELMQYNNNNVKLKYMKSTTVHGIVTSFRLREKYDTNYDQLSVSILATNYIKFNLPFALGCQLERILI